MQLSSKN